MRAFSSRSFNDTLVITAPSYDENDISPGSPTYPSTNAVTYKGSLYPSTSLGADIMTAVQQRLGSRADYVLDIPVQPGTQAPLIGGPDWQVEWSNGFLGKPLVSLAESDPDVRDPSGQPLLWRTWLRLTQ
jgi:hypothetical protein